MSNTAPLFPGYASQDIATAPGITIRTRTGGKAGAPPLLLLHGHPQTHAIWHKVAPALGQHFSLVMADLRGYGDSSKPPGDADHGNYSKRAMAQDMLHVMTTLGHTRFAVLAHDRGARVAHRLAVDHGDAVSRMVLLDIAPTLAMYEQTNEAFARAYWHWFFLIQPPPLPERLIAADPKAYLHDVMGNRSAGLSPFDPRAMAEYERTAALPGTAHSVCEDYRAAATIDLDHDRADRARGFKLTLPLMALWGAEGVVERCFKPLDEWRRVASDLQGHTLPCGHYIPEEAPEALLAAVVPFLKAAA
jgi:haloacetate dehalogenase